MRVATTVHYMHTVTYTFDIDTASTTTAIAEGRAGARLTAMEHATQHRCTFQLGDTKLEKENQ